ncbi:MAG: hypothetical protein AB1468_00715 [Candidatus Micrarchaeota archaeon]
MRVKKLRLAVSLIIGVLAAAVFFHFYSMLNEDFSTVFLFSLVIAIVTVVLAYHISREEDIKKAEEEGEPDLDF